MKISSLFFLVWVFAFLSISTAQTKDHPGKKVFMDSKCQTCHSVESHNLTSKSKKSIDLSNVGAVYRANFLEQFLQKKDKIDGKQHPFLFKGSSEDLNQLAEWLQTLNTGESGKEMKNEKDKTKTESKTGADKKTDMKSDAKDTTDLD